MFRNYALAFATAGGVPNFGKNTLFPKRGANVFYERDCDGGDCRYCEDVLCPFYEVTSDTGRSPKDNSNSDKDDRLPKAGKRWKINFKWLQSLFH